MTANTFTFEISLSVLNHLGRHLYRSFATVLGEAISNSWDADAKRVFLYVDDDGGGFTIVDDGLGMNAEDFQSKFLKVGYSKRKSGRRYTDRKRPYIGRKGIGKLALLSCSERVTVISRKKGQDWIGGVIENRALDDAIQHDLTADEYPLGTVDMREYEEYTHLRHGTIIRFDDLKEPSKHSKEMLAKTLALYFRFSLIDDDFTIFLNDEEITHENLEQLIEKTQFVWVFGKPSDPFVDAILDKRYEGSAFRSKQVVMKGVKGFIASVKKPGDLKIRTTEERVGVDLFVNGRLRERDILKHVPSAQVPESYLYGQIHVDSLDDGSEDRFTSSREGVVADDPVYSEFLDRFRVELLKVIDQWDKWRIEIREDGDPENKRLTPVQRASKSLFNTTSKKFVPETKGKVKPDRVSKWLDELANDAQYNYEAYAECFIAENLVREHIRSKNVALSKESRDEIRKWKDAEESNLGKANISIPIHAKKDDLVYLSMDGMANLVDKVDRNTQAGLSRDAIEFKPLRNAVAHTSVLAPKAKAKLTLVRENISSRLRTILSKP